MSLIPLDSSMTAVRKFTTSISYLIDHEATEVIIPTISDQDEHQSTPVSTLLAQECHAHSSSVYFPPGTAGFIQNRVIEDGYTLELRWTSTIKGPAPNSRVSMQDNAPFTQLDDQHSTLAPVRFIFPARIAPHPAFIISTNDNGSKELHLYVVTVAGYLYVLKFDQPSLFYALDRDDLQDSDWCEEIKVASLDGKSPILMDCVDEGRVTVACSDSFAVALTLAEGSGELIEEDFHPF